LRHHPSYDVRAFADKIDNLKRDILQSNIRGYHLARTAHDDDLPARSAVPFQSISQVLHFSRGRFYILPNCRNLPQFIELNLRPALQSICPERAVRRHAGVSCSDDIWPASESDSLEPESYALSDDAHYDDDDYDDAGVHLSDGCDDMDC
jgi:hypothetical protein